MTTNYLENQRSARGFHTTASLITSVGPQNTILDEHSILISEGVTIGYGNVFYPGVTIERQDEGTIEIGNNNIFYPGTYIYCSLGSVTVEDQNEFGPAGFTLRANTPDAHIEIGNGGRYCDGASIMGKTTLGSGSQVIGIVTVQNCTLGEGGTSKEPNPDKRGAVLKGFGRARGIDLATGEVINGNGDFTTAPIEMQRSYHPGSPK